MYKTAVYTLVNGGIAHQKPQVSWGTMIRHFWQQFGSKLPHIWQWSSKISWQRRNAPL